MAALRGVKVRRWARRALQRWRPGSVVLLYHRIGERAEDPLHLFVSPRHFGEQLEVLRGRLLSLARVSPALGERSAAERSFAITFDDGYADVARAALPLLERHEAPATVFVTTGAVDGRAPFPWDAPGAPEDRALASRELLALAESPLIEVGAHTVSHPRLPELPRWEQEVEASGSRGFLAEVTGRPVQSFAYPHGRHDRRTRAVLAEAGFTRAGTSQAAFVHATSDPLRLPRVEAPDFDGDRFAAWLRWWGL